SQRRNNAGIEALPDVGHKPPAVGVKPPQRQFFRDLGHVWQAGLVHFEAHQVGGLCHEVRLGIDEPGAPRFLLLSKPSTISGVAGAWAVEDLLTESFAAVAFTVDLRDLLFRFVIWVLLKSRRAPKRGPVAKVEDSSRVWAESDPQDAATINGGQKNKSRPS